MVEIQQLQLLDLVLVLGGVKAAGSVTQQVAQLLLAVMVGKTATEQIAVALVRTRVGPLLPIRPVVVVVVEVLQLLVPPVET
jgi:hypothetical protein